MKPKPFLILLLTALPLLPAFAAPKTITCRPDAVFRCTPQRCEAIPVIDLDGTEQSFTLDLEHRTVEGILGRRRFSAGNLTRNRGNEEAYVFFGARPDTAYDWVLSIDKKSGKMTSSSASKDESFTLFGTCTWKGLK